MKKKYIKPEIEDFELSMEGMLALSLPDETRDNVEVGAPVFDGDEEEWDK